MFIRLTTIVLSLLLLGACGGSSTSSGSDSGTLSVFATDNLTEQFSEVWVTIKAVTAESENGAKVSLFESTGGETLNLATLANIGSLLSAQNLPAGVYSDFEIVLASEVRLVANDGTVITASLSASDSEITVRVDGRVTVDAGQATSVAFDFDLEKFTYDSATGLVSPVIVMKDKEKVNQLDRRFAEIEGSVVEILSADSFVMQLDDSDTTLTVTLHAVAGIALASANGVIKDANLLQIGDEVEVFGNYDSDLLTLDAVRVQIEKSRGTRLSANNEIEGRIVSFDGSTLVIDVKQSNFLPEADTISVANVTNALFIHGALAQLGADQWVEIRGTWDGSTFSAKIIDVEGADLNESGQANDYAEVEGVIIAVDNGTVSLDVIRSEGLTLEVDSLNVDISSAWHKNSGLNCIAVGVTVEIKGSASSAGIFTANVIEFESGCGTATNDSDSGSMQTPPPIPEHLLYLPPPA